MDNPSSTFHSPANLHQQRGPQNLKFSCLTISDTRTKDSDKSGAHIIQLMENAGHRLVSYHIVADESSLITDRLAAASEEECDVILSTGGTGIATRDRTPECVEGLLDVKLDGFGELFRQLSYLEIGPAAMLSRAVGGRRGRTLIFALPGSRNAVDLALRKILLPQLPHMAGLLRGA